MEKTLIRTLREVVYNCYNGCGYTDLTIYTYIYKEGCEFSIEQRIPYVNNYWMGSDNTKNHRLSTVAMWEYEHAQKIINEELGFIKF